MPSPRSRAPPVKQGYLYVRNVGTATFNRRLFVLRRDGVLLTASAPTSASDLSAGESSASQIDVTDPAVQKSLTPVGQLLDVSSRAPALISRRRARAAPMHRSAG